MVIRKFLFHLITILALLIIIIPNISYDESSSSTTTTTTTIDDSSSSSSSSSPPSDFSKNIDDSSSATTAFSPPAAEPPSSSSNGNNVQSPMAHLESILTTLPPSDFSATTTFSPPPAEPPSSSSNGNSNSKEVQSPMAHLESILTTLGFQELAAAVPSLSDSAYYTWNGPSTVFAPTDDSIRSCIGSGSVSSSCSVPQILREHIVPGIFSYDYLNKLAFGTKLETMSTGRCITVTTASSTTTNNNNHDSSSSSNNDTSTIVYIGGVEITHPDFFNNGLVVVHRLEGFISPVSPLSCNIERMNSFSFPPLRQTDNNNNRTSPISSSSQSSNNPQNTSPALMRLMLKDVMLRLHYNGFSILSQALKAKYPEIVNLQNMTVLLWMMHPSSQVVMLI
ncbi:hypothetical protein IFM89_037226 [Coptis chinensis]|uniref:FAS1 domain-containing protein n=1 Tax=Coptis chinensis TaxID=261450 RepID=A0A835H8A4_9MAGN|nr:hypothetical protein IFM89_037226 [Coptis chinensis]